MKRYAGLAPSGAHVVEDLAVLNGLLQTFSVERTRYAEIDVTSEIASGEIPHFLAEPVAYHSWNRRAKRFGIRYRHVITPRVACHSAMRELVPATAGFIDWRVTPDVTTRIHVQESRALTALAPGNSHAGALVVEGAAVTGWKRMAEAIWADARPWSAAAADQAGTRVRAVADLLLEGLDDEAVARRLGVSVRTVRRDVSELMTARGARSRLQLGAVLASGS